MSRKLSPQQRPSKSGAFLFLTLTLFPSVVSAAELSPGVTLDTELRAQGTGLHNGDLDTSGSDNIESGSLEARFKLGAVFSDTASFFGEARGVAGAGRAGFQSSDTGDVSGQNSFLELRQAYVQFDDLTGTPLAFRAGRQKIREPYGIWWNQNFDSARALYESTIFTGSITAGENLFSYRTGPDDFRENQEDIASVLAEGSWQYYFEHFLEARLMYQDDHSDVNVGDIEPLNDTDQGESNLVYGGLRASGKTGLFRTGKALYRADLLAVAGSEDTANRAPAGGGNSVVTSIDDRDVVGWGFDGAVDIPLPNATPLIHLGYAYGSGDDDPAGGTDNAFRQTELAGNFSRIGALTRNTDNYGTVLRPELSNIHILSAGVTMPVLAASDVGVIYRYYRLAEDATSLSSSAIDDTLNGSDKDIGQGIDILFNMDIAKEANLNVAHVTDLSLRGSLGFFLAGDAYGVNDDELAARGLVEVKVGF